MSELPVHGRIGEGGEADFPDAAPRHAEVERSIVGMTLAEVLVKNWTLRIRCLNPECGHLAEPTMRDLAVGFRRGLGAPIPELAARMFCKRCGGRRLKAYNVQGGEFTSPNADGAAGREVAFKEWLAEVWRKP